MATPCRASLVDSARYFRQQVHTMSSQAGIDGLALEYMPKRAPQHDRSLNMREEPPMLAHATQLWKSAKAI